ncbi:MAG: DMT family transporter [Candidatus Woesearchaeota archaeon]
MALAEGIIFGLIAMLGWGASKVIVKPAIRKLGPYNALLYEHIFLALLLVIFSAPFIKPVIPGTRTLVLLISAVIIGSLAIYSLFRAFDIGKVSVTSPIAHSATLITVVLSILFYDESLTTVQMLAVAFLIAGVIMISFRYSDLKKLRLRNTAPGAGFAALTMLGWGIYFFMIKPIVMELGPLLSVVYLETGITIIIAVPLLLKKARLPDRTVYYTIFSGAAVALASWAFNMGIRTAPVSIVYPVANSSVLVTLLLSYIFLKERLESNQRLAIALIIIGLVLVSI